jgi:hypothetical protein
MSKDVARSLKIDGAVGPQGLVDAGHFETGRRWDTHVSGAFLLLK